MREASSLALMKTLWGAGAKVRAYDPEAMGETSRLYSDQLRTGASCQSGTPKPSRSTASDLVSHAPSPPSPLLELVESQDQALEGADALVICTQRQLSPGIRNITLNALQTSPANKEVIAYQVRTLVIHHLTQLVNVLPKKGPGYADIHRRHALLQHPIALLNLINCPGEVD